MFTLSNLLIASAYAQDSAGLPPGGANTNMLMNFLPIVLIFGVFYVLVIRPQQKKMDDQAKMVKALQRGDKVITTGGIYGKIVKLDGDDILFLEIADNVQIKIQRAHVAGLENKPVATTDASAAKKG